MSHYEIFRECFPGLKLTSDLYKRLADEEHCKSIDLPEGFALVRGNSLRLLCVLPQERGKGAGTRLFRAAEEFIRAQGCTRMEIGSPDSELFIGAPEDSCGFFEKLGCTFGEKVAEMSAGKLELPEKPQSGAEFGVYSGDREKLRSAVAKVDTDWTQYFGDAEVFCAMVGGEIASFCILGDNEQCLLSDGKTRMGSVGCVGTVPGFRRRGIGLEMVAEASKLLLQRCCDDIFIHYTAVYDWYARLGFQTRLFERLGGKNL